MWSPLIVVTDRRQAAEAAGRGLVDVVTAAVEGGADTVLLREKDLPRNDRARLAAALLGVLAPAGGALLVASDVALAQSVGAAGVHLAAADAWPDPAGRSFFEPERPVGDHLGSKKRQAGASERPVVGRSCHSVDELRAAQGEGVDYATLSPIWATDSKPGYGPALDTDGLAAACAAVPGLPVYALGGVTPGRAAACRAAGATGVAVMGAIMRADDPAKVVRMLLEEWS
jgi:thiamine-phosphate pyrophosphorylase